ncbi:MAG: hypothetical protein ACI9OJ_004403 [Myxococcota bacterium]|jgi:hypothetical protein
MGDLNDVVAALRADHGEQAVPGFDPKNGNEDAKILLILETPGPGAVRSRYVSMTNDDPTAHDMRRQLVDEAGLAFRDVALWNIVPWYVGDPSFRRARADTADEIRAGAATLRPVLDAMPCLAACRSDVAIRSHHRSRFRSLSAVSASASKRFA